MRIAIFCYNVREQYVGGAQTPALAFYDWIRWYSDVSAELVTNDVKIAPSIMTNTWRVITDDKQLNDYDFIFFTTINALGDNIIDFSVIKKPYSVPMFSEKDPGMYRDSAEIIMRASLLIHIGELNRNYFPGIMIPTALWFPCTMPDYLLGSEASNLTGFRHEDKFGLVYAARIARNKGIYKLAELSKNDDFYKSVDCTIEVHGTAYKPWKEEQIREMGPRWNRHDSIFNVHDMARMGKIYGPRKWFWCVLSDRSFEVNMKRLSLSAVEALWFGCIPIIDHEVPPESVWDFCVHIDEIEANPALLTDELYEKKILKFVSDINGKARQYSYYGVREQIDVILYRIRRIVSS